jgi:hypothetical protein
MIPAGARMKMTTSIVLAALVLAPACGGGGGEEGATGGSPTTLAAAFLADQFTPGANTVSMSQGNRAGDAVTVKVNLTDTSSVFGVAFDVAFDDTKVAYTGFAKGTALENNGNTPNYTVDGSAQPGRIVVGVSRAGSTTTAVSGTKTVISLMFRVKVTGDFPISFENAVVEDGQAVPQPLPGISWFAGALQGT